MPKVDMMKTLQGWSDVSITLFHDLSIYGEQIVLSVRYGSGTITKRSRLRQGLGTLLATEDSGLRACVSRL